MRILMNINNILVICRFKMKNLRRMKMSIQISTNKMKITIKI